MGVTFTEGVNAYKSPPVDRNNNGVYDFLEVTRPEVILQPESISVLAGESRTFTTSVSFFTNFDLQWQSSTNSGTTWTNIAENASFTNVNSPTLNVLNIQTSQDKHQFRVAVIPFCGNTVYSNAALLSVNATNTCPKIANPISDITINEDSSSSTINISSVFNDVDGQALTYTLSNTNSSIVSVSLSGTTITYQPLPNQNGTSTVTVFADDGYTPPIKNCLLYTSDAADE